MEVLNYIGGAVVPAVDGGRLINIDPATGENAGSLPDSGPDDVEEAFRAATDSFDHWSGMPVNERATIMRDIARRIDDNRDELARLESEDNGKPVRLAEIMDIPRAASNMRFYAGAVEHYATAAHITDNNTLNYTHRSPLGVVGCISPWNLPLYLFTWKIAPALAAGNVVIAKPSELTPVTAFRFCQLCEEAGLPPGVLNVLHGRGAAVGEAIVNHSGVAAISFTGGTATGQRIASQAAPSFKKLSLEMGGKNPSLIFADCDLNEAIRINVRSSFTNQGEICLCGSRILVEEAIYEEFLEKFIHQVRQMKTGDPQETDTDIGALVSEGHLHKVMEYVDLAGKEGGDIRCGGKRIEPEGRCVGGFFYSPTVITGLSMKCRTNQEEIFGPVVTVMPFHDEEEAVQLANLSHYGLSATIWTKDLARAHRVAGKVQAGIIWINCWLVRDLRTPFGGWKNSGIGREGGWDALDFFTEPKNICLPLSYK